MQVFKRKLKSLIKRLLAKKGLKLVNTTDPQGSLEEQAFWHEYSKLIATPVVEKSDHPIELIIFSMDRAIQVHALLKSFLEKSSRVVPVQILYKANTPEHQQAYADLEQIFADQPFKFVKQESRESFKPQLLQMLRSIKSSRMFFLVDDILVKEEIDMDEISQFDPFRYVFSPRLGTHLTRCFTLDREQKVPRFTEERDDLHFWVWKDGDADWNYPLSVDGNVFSTAEIILLSEAINFRSPNTYEGELQKFNHLFLPRFGVCHTKSQVINLPINRVNTDAPNAAGDVDPEFLVKQWQAGKMLDYKSVYGLINESAHQAVDVPIVERN